ncbi:MAG: adenine phosphoribosyltransferase [Nitrososphaeria archaeon]
MNKNEDLKKYIRDIPDYPVKGVIFRDLTPLFSNAEAFSYTIEKLYDNLKCLGLDKIAAIEARGFIVGAPLAKMLNIGFAPIRKSGKLPWKKISVTYELEYGKETIEIHEDSIKAGEKVAIVDDLLATGGTSLAAIKLVEKLKGEVSALAFIVVLDYLKGREKLKDYKIINLVDYE